MKCHQGDEDSNEEDPFTTSMVTERSCTDESEEEINLSEECGSQISMESSISATSELIAEIPASTESRYRQFSTLPTSRKDPTSTQETAELPM